jgi:hypothetical protein
MSCNLDDRNQILETLWYPSTNKHNVISEDSTLHNLHSATICLHQTSNELMQILSKQTLESHEETDLDISSTVIAM